MDSVLVVVVFFYRIAYAVLFICFQSSMMAHTCDPSTREAKVGRAQASGQPGPQSFSLKKRETVLFYATVYVLKCISFYQSISKLCFLTLPI